MKLWDTPWKMLLRISVILLIAFFAASPLVRNAALATVLPKSGLEATSDARVLMQTGSHLVAQHVLKLLPKAVEDLQLAQGAELAPGFRVYVFATESAYERQGACPPTSRACAFRGHVSLSPRLAAELDTVQAILTHELSHVLLQQRMGMFKASRIPPWFAEGLAVMVSDGGGTEGIGREEVAASFDSGQHFQPDLASTPFTQKSARHFKLPHRLFYRQSAEFVKYLKTQRNSEFEALMNRLHAGMAFQAAFERSFSTDLQSLFDAFLKARAKA